MWMDWNRCRWRPYCCILQAASFAVLRPEWTAASPCGLLMTPRSLWGWAQGAVGVTAASRFCNRWLWPFITAFRCCILYYLGTSPLSWLEGNQALSRHVRAVFSKSFHFHKQVQLEIWPFTPVCLCSPSLKYKWQHSLAHRGIWGEKYQHHAGVAQLQQVTRANQSQYPQPGPNRILPSPCGRKFTVFWQSVKMKSYSKKSLPFILISTKFMVSRFSQAGLLYVFS